MNVGSVAGGVGTGNSGMGRRKDASEILGLPGSAGGVHEYAECKDETIRGGRCTPLETLREKKEHELPESKCNK